MIADEKRFENRLNTSNVKFNTQNPVWDNELGDALNVFQMIDLLNDYEVKYRWLEQKHQYNEEFISDVMADCERLEKENDELCNSSLHSVLDEKNKEISRLNGRLMEYEEICSELENENNVLKQTVAEQGVGLDFLKCENIHMRQVLEENRQMKELIHMLQTNVQKLSDDVRFLTKMNRGM